MKGNRPSSLERKLPLLMTSVLASTLVISLLLTYATLKQQSRQAALTRLRSATAQLVLAAQTGVGTLRTRVIGVSRDSVVVSAVSAVLANEPSRAILASQKDALDALDRVFVPADTDVVAELWTVDGRRVASLSRGTPSASAATLRAPELTPPATWYEGIDS